MSFQVATVELEAMLKGTISKATPTDICIITKILGVGVEETVHVAALVVE